MSSVLATFGLEDVAELLCHSKKKCFSCISLPSDPLLRSPSASTLFKGCAGSQDGLVNAYVKKLRTV